MTSSWEARFRIWLPMAALWLTPTGWYYQNVATLTGWQEHYLIGPLRDHGWQRLDAGCEDYERFLKADHHWHLSRWLAKAAAPVYVVQARATRRKHLRLEMARMAVALEIYRQETGAYPADLTALVPGHLAALPEDFDGLPLRYQPRPASGRYILYSVGEDLRDNGGAISSRDRERPLHPQDTEDTDIVWTYEVPPPPPKRERGK